MRRAAISCSPTSRPTTADGSDQNAGCNLTVGYGNAQTGQLDATSIRVFAVDRSGGNPYRDSTIVLSGAVYYAQPSGYARVTCSLYQGSITGSLNAIQVSSQEAQ